MGIKKLAEHYDIKHIVQVRNSRYDGLGKFVYIGSPLCSDLIIIGFDGKIKSISSIVHRGETSEIGKLLTKLENDSPEFRAYLLNEPDEFKDLKTVYVVERGRIYKKQCEKFGWPNCTTDGELMYDNTSFEDRKDALAYAKRSTTMILEWKSFRSSIKESFSSIWNRTKFLLKSFSEFLYARTICRWRDINIE
jgi:hypothetical protein